MATVRYAVLNKDGLVVNHILIDDPLPEGYYPGYGQTLVPLEPATITKATLDVVILKITDIPQIGDTLDVNTGNLTKSVPAIIYSQDEKGDLIPAASAPQVKLIPEAQSKKAIIDKSAVEVKTGGK